MNRNKHAAKLIREAAAKKNDQPDTVNAADGLVHRKDGKVVDPGDGHEVSSYSAKMVGPSVLHHQPAPAAGGHLHQTKSLTHLEKHKESLKKKLHAKAKDHQEHHHHEKPKEHHTLVGQKNENMAVTKSDVKSDAEKHHHKKEAASHKKTH